MVTQRRAAYLSGRRYLLNWDPNAIASGARAAWVGRADAREAPEARGVWSGPV
jgi:hypothetical protein